MILNPVVIALAPIPDHTAPQRVKRQREQARHALRLCAQYSSAPVGGYEQDANRVPLPNDGYYWSISHKTHLVAAVVSKEPIGIDVELIEPRNNTGLWSRIATAEEWALLGKPQDWDGFFRLWTAKEATVKAHGLGIGSLSDCVVTTVRGPSDMSLQFRDQVWAVTQQRFGRHIVAMTTSGAQIEWQFSESPLGE